jgi:outer membrane protein
MQKPDALTMTACLALALCPIAATAQDRELAFELGLGVNTAPAYEGSKDYEAGPGIGGSLSRLNWWFLDIDKGDGLGFGVGPSFRYLSERTAADYPRLAGIDDVDAALELGAQASYRWPNAEVFGAVRMGVTGHEGIVMDFGADAVLFPARDYELRIGPRLSFADDAYADTYFSVPGGAFLPAYDADAGLYSAGLEMSLRYDFNDEWALESTVGWKRLTGSVGDSPVVEDPNQGMISVLLYRKFDWRW